MADIKKPIINSIKDMVEKIPGWSPIDQLYSIFLLSYSTSDLEGDFIEVGSWCGRSANVLGLAAKLSGNCKVYCVDLFPEEDDWMENSDGTYSLNVKINDGRIKSYVEQTVWKEPFEKDIAPIYEKYNGIYDAFVKFVDMNGLNDVVCPIKGESSSLKENVPRDFKCKFAFIDGDHSYNGVCRDIENIEEYLVPGGWICFDDAFSSYEGVNKAIEDKIINSGNYTCCQQLTRKFFVGKKI
ncbi:class I SAM-dependent methyltransferase [Methanoplanus sp. FWC-SCC4]|uniref:Class I SAM-dependent methyltransferase n=1 Tax=Methanochimaera problematica TaxID=2609417 RepID=A0AA97I308_9EURY|nr:class I SAM-dependent methyltransferase [Methanoplanus sp. FWC-SCC4]WOF15386.1 class I SAM-dependent methyltransferase [Methanoplanus sp. FWC-SCC4]